ncbi:ABC transporter ATP-binding protein [Streptococcus sanguinis]|jgi:ABC-type antimicrobial peptide transport system ATPase component|uniref:Antimicrobial peptide ABC transporter ATPase component n=1 Tax=Streptococcus sanguinis TaxID=1305 RepID=A0A2X3V1I9_STRSA|nr:ABC transporter ATP-binding protein [Streptococcus sanguinis]EGJ44846.1 ABC superfamily ATP binding cassette transporter, ABC protein [Streptococcus sanguinis SK1059]EGQ21633.1 ABC superfamily ATP binding cassette transporter, ABC protein [Streptococcus sanguinis ATCC 29667]SQF35130.1 antimicrobial peptide ABC transporter ATPase component [Streptococcus sanguinis]
MKGILEVNSIVKNYSERDHILKGISLNFEAGTFNVLLGQSGSGKSTLLNIMSGLLKPTSGIILINNQDINIIKENQLAALRRNIISNIYQDYMLLSELTVQENIELGMGKNNLNLKEIVNKLGIASLLDKYPDELSGGQKQRTAIARAIIKKPELLFCDEATGALDEENSKQVIELLHDIIKTYGITVIFATHNLKISLTADRVITIGNGKIVQDKHNKTPLLPSDIDWGINI